MKEQKLMSKHSTFFLKLITSSIDGVIFFRIISTFQYKKYIFKPCLSQFNITNLSPMTLFLSFFGFTALVAVISYLKTRNIKETSSDGYFPWW